MDNPEKKRREYLQDISFANSLKVVGGGLGLFFGLIFVFYLLSIALYIIRNVSASDNYGPVTGTIEEISARNEENRTRDWFPTNNSDNRSIGGIPVDKILTVVACTSFVPALCGLFLWNKGKRIGRIIPYVPSVAEQLAVLPVKEILVRSSGQPAALQEELLRAAHEGAVEPTAELLRAESRAE